MKILRSFGLVLLLSVSLLHADFISQQGGGSGDMTKATYDSNADGSVNAADYATVALSATSANSSGVASALSAQYIDWSASSGATSIANKPTLGTAAAAATTDFDAAGAAAGVKDKTAVTGILYGNGSIIQTATSGNFPTLNQNTTGSSASCTGNAATVTIADGQILIGNGSAVGAAYAISGDISMSGTGVTTIGSNVVTNAKAAQMAANTLKGNNTGSTANAADLTVAQVNTMLSLADGTYGPTATAVSNVDSCAAGTAKYLRVGNTVLVSGYLTVDATGTGATQVGISFPIASNVSDTSDCSGCGNNGSSAGENGATIFADTTNHRATFYVQAVSTSSINWWYQFTYIIK